MEERGIEAFVKYNRFHIEQRPRYVQDPFRSENFYYNEKEDYCVCPMGQHMNRIGQKEENRKRIHLGKASLSSPKLQWLPTAFTLL